jgi:4-amino-4-deoxychorismate lyase
VEDPLRQNLSDPPQIIETMGWRPGEGLRWREDHLARMAGTAARLGYSFDRGEALALLSGIKGEAPLRCRLTLDALGRFDLTAAPLAPNPPRWRVVWAEARLNPSDPWIAVKTTRRAPYDTARAALKSGEDEALFLNARGEVAEGTITNVFVEMADGRRLTPPLSAGCLPGILRGRLLAEGWQEGRLAPADLATARKIWVGNALRGLIEADLSPFA